MEAIKKGLTVQELCDKLTVLSHNGHAQAIVRQPKVLLFDEPTSHLDFGNQVRVLRLIREMADQGYSVVFTTHNPDHAIMLGGKVAILDRDGHLEYGTVDAVLTEERLKDVYQTDLSLIYVDEIGRRACLAEM